MHAVQPVTHLPPRQVQQRRQMLWLPALLLLQRMQQGPAV
jgi:hypothetical protein